MKRTEDSLRDLWDNIKCTNIRIIGVPEEEEKKKEFEKNFEEIIVENFPSMEKEKTLHGWLEATRPIYYTPPLLPLPRVSGLLSPASF